jgi:hypothetical protein
LKHCQLQLVAAHSIWQSGRHWAGSARHSVAHSGHWAGTSDALVVAGHCTLQTGSNGQLPLALHDVMHAGGWHDG